jgi:uncharacterized protein YjbJ (UPF0337 family)
VNTVTDNYLIVPPHRADIPYGETTADAPSDTAGVAREQASQLKDSAAEAGAQVAETVKEQAGDVVDEAKTQAKGLLEQAQAELREQAGAQQQRAASGLRDLSDQLKQMAESVDSPGVAVNLVSDLSSRADAASSWLGGREPGSLLDDVKTFARNRPGTFIVGAVIAGLVAGRLTRSISENARAHSGHSTSASTTAAPSRASAESRDELWSAQPSAAGSATAPATDSATERATAPAAATPLYASLAEERVDDPTAQPVVSEPQTERESW